MEKFQAPKHKNNEIKIYLCNIGGYAQKPMAKSLDKGLKRSLASLTSLTNLNCSTFMIKILHKKK